MSATTPSDRATFEVLTPGLSTTVQDRGRFGYYNVGLPQGGSLDNYSSQAANMLVGNSPDEAVLECTYMGANLRFDSAATIAVTGGDIDVTVNGEPAPTWQTVEVPAGGTVEFGMLRSGARFYIAVHGGVDVPVVLGSRSTYPLGQMGGFNGRKLEAGDVLPIGDGSGEAPRRTVVDEAARPSFAKQQDVRILMGLYDFRLTETGKRNLVEGEWELTPVADRAGLRYKGPEWSGWSANSPSARVPTRRTSSMPATPWVRSRSPAARSRSSFTVTPSQAAAMRWWPRSSARIWISSPGPLPARRRGSSR